MTSLSTTREEAVVFINGDYVPESEAKISIFDHGLLYGDAVFDTMCSWGGRIFKLERHLNRLSASLHAVRLEIPYAHHELRDAVVKTVAMNQLQNAYIKILVTRGASTVPAIDPRGCASQVIIFARPYHYLSRPGETDAGITAKIASVRRIPAQCLDPKIKNVNYLSLIMAKWEGIDSGVDEVILLDTDGFVSEGPGYNLFILKDACLITAPDNILMGITRETVLDLATELNLPVNERRFTPFDIYTADEAFFSTTAGGIIPIAEVDGRRIGGGRAGSWTHKLQQRYLDLVHSDRFGTSVMSS